MDRGFTSAGANAGGFDWETVEDLTSLPEAGLRDALARVSEQERAAAYRHEMLRGRLNLIRAELAGRGLASLPSDELARVLLGEVGE